MYIGTSSQNYDDMIDCGNNTSCTISGLQVDETYYFAVTAYNKEKVESDKSKEISYTVPLPDPTPNPVTKGNGFFDVLEIGEVQVDHNWTRASFKKSFSR